MSIDKITSAYNFVPLQAKVVTPDWQDRTSQDVPLQDGLCAEIDLTLTNHTPLLVGGSDTEAGPKRFHCHPDGIPAIPGSSFRGMIRNVLEIASCASMKLIDDRALSLRDLDLDAYKQAFRSKPRAGWLSFCHDRKSWVILEVDYGFIEQRQMQDIKIEGHRVHDLIFKQWELASDDDKRKAELKYRAIGKPLKTWFMPDDLPNAYKLCKKDEQGKVKVGYIVFTGQPGDMDKNPSEHKKTKQPPAKAGGFEIIRTESPRIRVG
jgi:RAMP superfamily